jgi:hypothetical protein
MWWRYQRTLAGCYGWRLVPWLCFAAIMFLSGSAVLGVLVLAILVLQARQWVVASLRCGDPVGTALGADVLDDRLVLVCSHETRELRWWEITAVRGGGAQVRLDLVSGTHTHLAAEQLPGPLLAAASDRAGSQRNEADILAGHDRVVRATEDELRRMALTLVRLAWTTPWGLVIMIGSPLALGVALWRSGAPLPIASGANLRWFAAVFTLGFVAQVRRSRRQLATAIPPGSPIGLDVVDGHLQFDAARVSWSLPLDRPPAVRRGGGLWLVTVPGVGEAPLLDRWAEGEISGMLQRVAALRA